MDKGVTYIQITVKRFLELTGALTFKLDEKKSTTFGLLWMKWDQKRQVRQTYFQPLKDLDDQDSWIRFAQEHQICNMFGGFKYRLIECDEDTQSAQFWTNHLEMVIPDIDRCMYVIRAFADIFQNPHRSCQVVLIFHGVAGAGKTAIFAPFGELMGRFYTQDTGGKALHDQYNGALLGQSILMMLDDYTPSKDPAKFNEWKSTITANGLTTSREMRQGPATQSVAHLRFMVTINNRIATHILLGEDGIDKRRSAAIQVEEVTLDKVKRFYGDTFATTEEYFTWYWQQACKNPQYLKALYRYLCTGPTPLEVGETIPLDSATARVIEATNKPFLIFIKDYIMDGPGQLDYYIVNDMMAYQWETLLRAFVQWKKQYNITRVGTNPGEIEELALDQVQRAYGRDQADMRVIRLNNHNSAVHWYHSDLSADTSIYLKPMSTGSEHPDMQGMRSEPVGQRSNMKKKKWFVFPQCSTMTELDELIRDRQLTQSAQKRAKLDDDATQSSDV